MWAVLQWSSRLYVLTDMRIVAISGVFNAQIFDCALRKIARTRLIFSSRERICRLGSIEIIPLHDDAIRRPVADDRQAQAGPRTDRRNHQQSEAGRERDVT